MHGILPKVVESTINYKQQLRNNTILSRALLRNAQNVMLRFMVQAFKDPPLCSNTIIPDPQHCFVGVPLSHLGYN
jgi:hypothetical protein